MSYTTPEDTCWHISANPDESYLISCTKDGSVLRDGNDDYGNDNTHFTISPGGGWFVRHGSDDVWFWAKAPERFGRLGKGHMIIKWWMASLPQQSDVHSMCPLASGTRNSQDWKMCRLMFQPLPRHDYTALTKQTVGFPDSNISITVLDALMQPVKNTSSWKCWRKVKTRYTLSTLSWLVTDAIRRH